MIRHGGLVTPLPEHSRVLRAVRPFSDSRPLSDRDSLIDQRGPSSEPLFRPDLSALAPKEPFVRVHVFNFTLYASAMTHHQHCFTTWFP